MNKPYIKRLKKINEYDIWIVDGKYIRDKINEEFTNFGLNQRFRFIPKNQLWIDREYGKRSEIKFYIKNMIKEKEILRSGKDYDTAFKKAEKLEKEIRKKYRKKISIKKLYQKILQDKINKYSGKISVWLVNGKLVRDFFNVDFTEGGHDLVYSFIPKDQIWIDDELRLTERRYVILHELHERNLMKKGIKYEQAHRSASSIELKCRRNPNLFELKFKEDFQLSNQPKL